MSSIQRKKGAEWWSLAFVLLMSAGSTVAVAEDWRSAEREKNSGQRDSGNRQQQAPANRQQQAPSNRQQQASGTTWRDAERQQRQQSSRQNSENRQAAQGAADRQRPDSQQQPRRDGDRQNRRDDRGDRENRGDRPGNAQQGSNGSSRRDQTWAEAARQQREDRRHEQGRGEPRREGNRGDRDHRDHRDHRGQNHREQAFQNYRRRGRDSRHYHSIGHNVRTLPRHHSRFLWNSSPYFYGDGYFYRPSSYGYVVVGAPFGYRLSVLPVGYATFYLDRHRYHYVNDTYYRWYDDTRDYVVVDEPEGATDALYRVSEIAAASLYIYPTKGQTEEQREQDRFECHLWAVDESGFDPSYSEADKAGYENYRRAMTACLEGRGYSVK